MSGQPLLLGHRGARATRTIPENSFASFDLALQHGCDGFEFDVRPTGCGSAIVCHDAKVGRVTVSRATCGQLPDLPRLEDVLHRYGHCAFLDVELKVRGLEPLVLAALRQHPPQRDYVVSSFLPGVFMELKARNASVPLGMICQKPAQLARWRKLPVDYLIAHRSLVSQKLVETIHQAGKRIFAWTVNKREEMLRLAEWEVDAIISDDTALLVGTIRST
jgi:glycerophosphoryl diester phosphodiesterase